MGTFQRRVWTLDLKTHVFEMNIRGTVDLRSLIFICLSLSNIQFSRASGTWWLLV